MIVDLRTLEDGTELEADVVVIGAGAAGITIALTLARSTRLEVLLLESGGVDFDPDVQDLYRGENIGRDYFDLDVTRLRQLGGSTNHWGGFCAPLHPTALERRAWVADSGWPIGAEELDPYYERAETLCDMGPYIYDERLLEMLGREPVAFDPDKIEYRFLHQRAPPLAFGEAYREELTASPRVRLLLHANVTEIVPDEDVRTVDHLVLATLDGKRMRARGRAVVLACGAIENARLLLASTRRAPAGLGNGHDLVGRYFMEHPSVTCGVIATEDALALNDRLVGSWTLLPGTERTRAMALAGLSASVQRQRQLLGCGFSFTPVLEDGEEDGAMAALEIFRALREGRAPEDLGARVLRVLGDLGGAGEAVYRRLVHGIAVQPRGSALRVGLTLEQAPDPHSRLMLADERDALGVPRIRLDWRLGTREHETAVQGTRVLAAELGRLELGRMRLEPWLAEADSGWPEGLHGGNHHMGTTRMHADARRGVVDPDGRVHGLADLYVAGSSVFPTSGVVNPTLTIVALALRQADHLASVLAR